MSTLTSIVGAIFKTIWLEYKENKEIKKREPYIKAMLNTIEGKALNRAVVEALGNEKIFMETEDTTGTYLDEFEKEDLIKITDKINYMNGIMYVFKLTFLGKKYLK